MAELGADIQAFGARGGKMEDAHAEQAQRINKCSRQLSYHSLQLAELHRHLEDPDNHGQRHNIRLWGLLESVSNDQLEMVLLHIFNDLLGRP